MNPARVRVYAFEGVIPVIDPSAFVHPSAVLLQKFAMQSK